MNQNDNVKEISLLDMLIVLGRKWKMLLCLTLVALLVGGGVGLTTAILSNQSYGATAEFYIYSDKANKYILSLIQSDSFAEALLMDENGLPAEYKGTDIYKDAVKAKEAVEQIEEQLKEKEKELLEFEIPLSNLNKAMTDAQTTYTEIYNHLSMMYSSANAENYKEQIDSYEDKLLKAKEEKDEAKTAYNEKFFERQDVEQEIKALTEQLEDADKAKDQTYDKVFSKYRTSAKDSSEKVAKVKNAVAYRYAEASDVSSQAVLYAEIAVPKDEALAKLILEKISEKLPAFIEDNMSEEVTCEYISSFSSVEKLEVSNPVKSAVLYGAVSALLVLFVASCVVVCIYIYKTDKQKSKD